MAKVKGRGKKQKLIINDKGGSSEEETKGGDTAHEKPCKHISKAVRTQSLKNTLSHLKNGECKDCRGKPKVAPELKDTEDAEFAQSVCICLKCCYQGCSRNSLSQHAHSHFQHQSTHTICVNTTNWVVWCYACDKELNASDDNAQLQKAMKMIRETKNKASKENTESNSCITGTIKGLRNLGNTCFFNSVLQNISQTTALVSKLDSLCGKEEEIKIENDETPKVELAIKKTTAIGPLTAALKCFLDEFHSSSRGIVVPSKLFGEITKKSPQFGGYRQQDSQELLRYLLDGMRVEELKRIESAMKDAVKKLECPPTKEQLKDCFKNAKTFVDDVFGGTLVSTIICFECRSKSQVYECFFDLSLPVNSNPKESAKSAAARLINGVLRNEAKSQTGSDEESKKKLSKHKRKALAKKEKKAKRGNRKISIGGSKGNNSTSDKQNSDNEHDGDEDDDDDDNSVCENGDSQSGNKPGSKRTEGCNQVISEVTESLKHFTIKDEADFVIVEKRISESIDSKEERPWESRNQAILGGSTSKFLECEASSMESLTSKDSIVTSRQNTYDGVTSNVSSKEDISKAEEEMYEISEDRQVGARGKTGDAGRIQGDVGQTEELLSQRGNDVANRICSDDDDDDKQGKKGHIPIEKDIHNLLDQVNNSELAFTENRKQEEHQKGRLGGDEHNEARGREEGKKDGDYGEIHVKEQEENQKKRCEDDPKMKQDKQEVKQEMEADSKQETKQEVQQEMKQQGEAIIKQEVQQDKEQEVKQDKEQEMKQEAEAVMKLHVEHEGEWKAHQEVDFERKDVKNEKEAEKSKEESQGKDDSDENSVEEGDEEDDEDSGEDDQETEYGDVETVSPEYECKPGECSVLSCLHQFTCKDVLDGNNKFRCEDCTKRRNEIIPGDGKKPDKLKPVFTVATKQMLMWQPPSVLTLHLKRFEQVGRGLRKVNKHIEFPRSLDLSSFSHVNKQVSKQDLQYNLYGIIEHSGSLHGGHYVACVKTRTIDNKFKWYYVSDSRVSEIQEEAVLRKQAYILFYHQANKFAGKLEESV